MLKIFVCDDEKEITGQIHKYITGYFINNPGEYMVTVFNSGIELFRAVKKDRADVIFLDIDLKDSNGIQIAKAIRQFDKQVKIIFITSYKNYKGAAFSVRAFGYVDKPVTGEQIFEQLADAEKYIQDEKKSVKFKFDTTEGLININLSEIFFFVNENRKIKIVTLSKNYYMRDKISVLAKQLADFNFQSPHASFLVNLDYVTDIKNYTVYMAANLEIPLSQRKSVEFREAVDRYLAQTILLCKEKNNV